MAGRRWPKQCAQLAIVTRSNAPAAALCAPRPEESRASPARRSLSALSVLPQPSIAVLRARHVQPSALGHRRLLLELLPLQPQTLAGFLPVKRALMPLIVRVLRRPHRRARHCTDPCSLAGRRGRTLCHPAARCSFLALQPLP